MKFLVAALCLCLALVGQIHGGSLRGIPHKEYGVPLLSSWLPTAEIDEKKPTTSKPFINDLPLIDSIVNFVHPTEKPSSNHIEIVTERPKIPLLQPGIPSLPAAPNVPSHNIEQSVQTHIEPSNSYLPPVAAPVVPQIIEQPIQVIHQELSNVDELPKPQLQPGLPTLPAAPIVPLAIEQPTKAEQPIHVSAELSNFYLPPKQEISGLPAVPVVPQLSGLINQGFSYINLPSTLGFAHVQPPASLIPLAISQPVQISQQLSNAYLPPKPQLPLLQPGLPSLPEAPKAPLTIAIEQPVLAHAELSNSHLPPRPELPPLQPGLPSLPEAPKVPITIATQAHAELSNSYLPPKPELPLLQPGLPSLPEAPKVPLTIATQTHAELSNSYLPPKPELPLLQPGLPSLPEAPKAPLTIAIEQPVLAHAELSNSYLPPKPELPLLQPGLPSLPEAPKVPLTIATQTHAELSNSYLPPRPELPPLQPGLPSLPEAPKVPITIATQAHAELSNSYLPPKPELPLLQPGLPSLPETPKVPLTVAIEQPVLAHAELSNSYLPPKPELPSLPEAPKVPLTILVPQPIQAQAEQSHYNYLTPALPTPAPIIPLLQPGLPALPAAPILPLQIEQPSSSLVIEQQQQPSADYQGSKIGYVYNKPATAFTETAQLSWGAKAPEKVTPILPAPILISNIKPESNEKIVTEVPALPAVPVIPASTQIIEGSKIGYAYSKPALGFLQDAELKSASRETIFINRPFQLVQTSLVQPSNTAQQVLVQPSVSIVSAANKAPSKEVNNLGSWHSDNIEVFVPHRKQQQQQVYVQHSLPAQQVLIQPSFPGQQVLVKPSVPVKELSSLGSWNSNKDNIEIRFPIRKQQQSLPTQQLLIQPSFSGQQVLVQQPSTPVKEVVSLGSWNSNKDNIEIRLPIHQHS